MTSFNPNWCGPFSQIGRMNHTFEPDTDGNMICASPGCGCTIEIVCTCSIDPDWTKYIGCPRHTENPRVILPRYGPWDPLAVHQQMAYAWMPQTHGGDLSREEADRLALELRHQAKPPAPSG